LLRGLACGVMTTAGGLGHALPYLIPDFWTATTQAVSVDLVELGIMAAPILPKADKADIEDVTHAGFSIQRLNAMSLPTTQQSSPT
jgi:hypothetical protein